MDAISMYINGEHGTTTPEEYLSFIEQPENKKSRYELVNGFIIIKMAGGASFNHGRISRYITKKIDDYLEGKQCEVIQDTNAYLFNEDQCDDINNCKHIFQPDIMVGCDKSKMTGRGYEGTPEFVVEIISKTSFQRDYLGKLYMYTKYGVKEYWIVDLPRNKVTVYLNAGEPLPDVFKYTFDDEVPIKIFGDFSIDFKEILKIVDKE